MSAAAGARVTANVVLTRRLGAGGMGTVWLAEHLALRKLVVVKLMNEHVVADETFRQRFAQEAAAGANVNSPHVVQVLDAGVSDELGPYIVMEALEGEDLAVRLSRERTLSSADVVRLVSHAAHALDRAHESGIVHRDIKPANLFLCRDPAAPFSVKVLDFGVARWKSETPLTAVGLAVGTPTYMSPEQAAGQELDGRSDLYSLALVAFRALTGSFAVTRASIEALGMGAYQLPLPKPTERRADLPAAVDAWFARAAAREPAARFGDGATMAAELARVLDVEGATTQIDAVSDEVATRPRVPPSPSDEGPRSSDPTQARRAVGDASPDAPTTNAALERPGAPPLAPSPAASASSARRSRRSLVAWPVGMLAVVAIGVGAWKLSATTAPPPSSEPRALSASAVASASAAPSASSIPIGVLLDLSGERRQAGQALLDATRAAVKAVNDGGGVRGRPLELVVSDDRGDDGAFVEEQARALVATRGVKVILGPMRSEQVVLVAPIAQAAGVLELTGSATSPSLSTLQRPDQRLLFRTVPSQTRIADALARVMRGEHVVSAGVADAAPSRPGAPSAKCSRVAIVASDDASGRPFTDAFVPAFKAHGGRSAEAFFVPPAAQLSYGKQLAELARARVDCQVLALSPKSAARYLRQAQVEGSAETDPRHLPTFAVAHLASEDFVEYSRAVPRDPASASVAEGVRGVRPATRLAARPESQELTFWLGAIDAGAESRDAPFVASQFDAAILAALTLEKAGPDSDANALRQGFFAVARGEQIFGPHEVPQLLAAVRRGDSVNYVGASGDLMFDPNGDVDAELETWVVRDGKVREDGRVAPSTPR